MTMSNEEIRAQADGLAAWAAEHDTDVRSLDRYIRALRLYDSLGDDKAVLDIASGFYDYRYKYGYYSESQYARVNEVTAEILGRRSAEELRRLAWLAMETCAAELFREVIADYQRKLGDTEGAATTVSDLRAPPPPPAPEVEIVSEEKWRRIEAITRPFGVIPDRTQNTPEKARFVAYDVTPKYENRFAPSNFVRYVASVRIHAILGIHLELKSRAGMFEERPMFQLDRQKSIEELLAAAIMEYDEAGLRSFTEFLGTDQPGWEYGGWYACAMILLTAERWMELGKPDEVKRIGFIAQSLDEGILERFAYPIASRARHQRRVTLAEIRKMLWARKKVRNEPLVHLFAMPELGAAAQTEARDAVQRLRDTHSFREDETWITDDAAMPPMTAETACEAGRQLDKGYWDFHRGPKRIQELRRYRAATVLFLLSGALEQALDAVLKMHEPPNDPEVVSPEAGEISTEAIDRLVRDLSVQDLATVSRLTEESNHTARFSVGTRIAVAQVRAGDREGAMKTRQWIAAPSTEHSYGSDLSNGRRRMRALSTLEALLGPYDGDTPGPVLQDDPTVLTGQQRSRTLEYLMKAGARTEDVPLETVGDVRALVELIGTVAGRDLEPEEALWLARVSALIGDWNESVRLLRVGFGSLLDEKGTTDSHLAFIEETAAIVTARYSLEELRAMATDDEAEEQLAFDFRVFVLAWIAREYERRAQRGEADATRAMLAAVSPENWDDGREHDQRMMLAKAIQLAAG
jgi:hypothetical protein